MSESILITGAAQRVGLHCALALRAQGYDVIATYRQDKHGLTQLRDAGVHCVYCDFDQPNAIVALVAAVTAKAKSLRAIIHNASSWQADAVLPCKAAALHANTDNILSPAQISAQLATDAGIFDAMMHIHAKVPYLLTRALMPNLLANGNADVIALTDFVASVGSSKHMAYAASRAAMENLVLSMSRQLAPAIKVNAIAPALLMFNDGDDAQYRQKALKKSLMQCEPGSQEVVNTINYLLASQYITGRVLALDGGRHLNFP
ncbi:MAG: dihydromonapterin reductase [Gammaproteobacteria bacterium]|nr:dihydromonapterin reductase [Gammaproteobacteria bacterium]